MGNYITMTTANDDDVEVQLPLEIIQHIQTSMIQSSESKSRGEKEAARTSLVSKSWYRAWSTHPVLVFNRLYFFSPHGDLFWEFAKTTLKRYENLNLKIRSLRLVMINDRGVSLAKELIAKAIKLGVVDLTIQIVARDHYFPDDDLEFQHIAGGSNLSRCSSSFAMNLSLDRRREKGEVSCYNLKSLKLKKMALNNDLFWDLKLRCPFIEEFLGTLYNTELKDDEFLDQLAYQFPKLEYLSLGTKHAPLLRPSHEYLWAKFACLKELKITYHRCNDDLRIRIPSLERLTISLYHHGSGQANVVEFDFPNIRELKMEGALPRRFELKTRTTCRDEWESEIDIIHREKKLSAEWFRRFSQFVRMLSLSRSRVSLSLYTVFHSWGEFTYEARYFGDGLAIPPMEKLTLKSLDVVTPAFLDALFWSCRPKFVEIQNQCLFGMKKVNVEEFQQLRSLPWETFYQVPSGLISSYVVCFQLN